MFTRLLSYLCLASLATIPSPPVRAAEQKTNLVDVLRQFMAPTNETPQTTSTVLTLAAGDILKLTVYQEDDLNLPRAVVAQDGTISHALLGSIPVAGKTLEEAQALVHEILQKDYLVNPRASLTVLEYAKFRITILKEVVRPETYDVPRNDTLTLIRAIGLAGGPTRLGNMSKVTVQRVVGGQKKEFKLDAESAEGEAFVIQADDVIEVPPKGR